MIEQQDKLMNALYEKSTITHNKKHSEIIEKTLDSKVVVIVDFENYQAIPTDLLNKDYIYYLFCGFITTKPAQEYKGMLEGYDINIVETKHIGTKIVDNRISMYIGYIFGKYNPKQVILVSNDIDYYEMMMDLKAHGYPIMLREPSLNSKEQQRREMDLMMDKLVELNNGKNIIGVSRIKFYLKSNMELSESELNKVLNRIKSQCELTEVKGTEEFYKLKG